MRLVARAPLRIDFAGGWTDVPLYAEAEGGHVLNAAITIYVRGSISRTTATAPNHGLRGNRSHLAYSLDAPTGAGLGASAAQTVLWTTLVKTSIANVTIREEIAEIACRVSASLGIVGGKQDEYASALGGILFLTFGETVKIERLQLPSQVVESLRSRLVLVYSGSSRLSGSIHEQVWSRYRSGDGPVREALASLKRTAAEMRSLLLDGNLEAFGALLSKNWENQKALHPAITNGQLDAIFDLALRRGALGGKACGAGGGGCLIFLAREGQEKDLRNALSSHKLRLLNFDFDTLGVHLGRG